MSDNKWRFPASNYGTRKGMSSGDTEAFKKSPFQAFAREILQNSVDVRASDEEPVIVEFKEFDIKTSKIPGYIELKDAMRKCRDFWQHKPEYVKEYDEMIKLLEKPTIHCLRVSDYNTTGLIGVNSSEQAKNNFLALTKGTGISEKNSSLAGGSKGVGKNAAFLMSSLRTVFYSTNANKNLNDEYGCYFGAIGVAELVSGYVDDIQKDNRDYTQGTGYFSRDNLNNPLSDILVLDPTQRNRVNNSGTDIYIIGFLDYGEWEKEVINSILDSFMAAIVRGDLEIVFNDKIITKETIGEIIYDDCIIFKNQRSNIISQYRLLTDGDNVSVYDIDTEYGNCQLYVLPYKKEEDELATHKCSMIRYPLMKIKDEPLGSSFRVSAMCIIGEGTLGKALREIENPQHIDWEPKRIKNNAVRKEIESILKSIKEQIRTRVIECLQLGESNPLDPNGAGDFLPDADFGEIKNETNGNLTPAENVSVSKPKENNTFEKNAYQKSDNGTGLEPDIGEVDSTIDGDVQHPSGENNNSGEGRHPGSEESGEKEGDNVIFKKKKLSGVRYKVISTDKENGKLKVVFVAPIDFKKCYLSILMLDDSNNHSSVLIKSMKCNGINIISEDQNEFGPFCIKLNQKIILDVETDSKGYFGSEVKVICK